MELKPQEGPQTEFLSTAADLAFYGGGAGGGKTFGLLFEALRHINNPRFSAVFFRRTKTDLTKPGGMLDTSNEIYPLVGGKYADFEWTFPSGAKVTLDGMEHEKDRFKWQGSQIALIGFDEATHFTANQFWYMLSRNRSASGIPGYVRAGCNPDPDSFIRQLLDWYIGRDGFPIKERDGKLRWFIRRGLDIIFADTREELVKQYGSDQEPKSLTFIKSTIFDNRILLEKDPGYLSNLKALSFVDRAQLLDGNWNVRAAAGLFFKRKDFLIVDAAPAKGMVCRYWDRAATEDGDWTVGLRLRRTPASLWYIEDVVRFRGSPHAVQSAIVNTASSDTSNVTVCLAQDPGQAGKADVSNLIRQLAGYNVRAIPETKDKETRARAVSAQAEAQNIMMVRGVWNEPLLIELENFPKGSHDDQVDALAGAFNYLNGAGKIMLAI